MSCFRPFLAAATLSGLLALSACGGFSTDPSFGRATQKADPQMTSPPAELRNGTAR